MTSWWKVAALVVLLASFFCIGIGQVIKPDWFIKRSGVRKGGELLSDWNRPQFQIVGVVFAGLAVYLLYILFRG
jgi:hypothetical protein